jgi:hypothetical protein
MVHCSQFIVGVRWWWFGSASSSGAQEEEDVREMYKYMRIYLWSAPTVEGF